MINFSRTWRAMPVAEIELVPENKGFLQRQPARKGRHQT
jgi:hypothetical protein